MRNGNWCGFSKTQKFQKRGWHKMVDAIRWRVSLISCDWMFSPLLALWLTTIEVFRVDHSYWSSQLCNWLLRWLENWLFPFCRLARLADHVPDSLLPIYLHRAKGVCNDLGQISMICGQNIMQLKIGFHPGKYNSWAECELQVKRFRIAQIPHPGAQCIFKPNAM